ncbi:MAG TPA: MFS transporter [Burkholderiaceae bacterium]|nr:MFS transporter [Burkholderiaceae bacterium]
MNRIAITLVLVMASTVLGLMGTDLVLPAIPHLPEALGTTASSAQLVLAAYVAGTCIGLLAFGALSDRVSTHRLFVGSLAATCLASLACGAADSIETLIGLRLVQGAAAAGPAVFAPALVKVMLPADRAVRALGVIGSVESLAPALAPIAGAGLLLLGGWQLSFDVLAALAALLFVAMVACGPLPQTGRRPNGRYTTLLRDATFLRYALSQALVLGGLLTFVFGMPAVFVRVMGGTLTDFIVMQGIGIVTFIAAANVASRAAAAYGPERVITFGTALALAGAAGQFAYALAGGGSALVIAALFIPVNSGLGLRGPPGFYRAVLAAHGDDARGSALVILFILGVTAAGTVLVSPWIGLGSAPLAGVALAFHVLALLSLVWLPRLAPEPAQA